MDFKYVNSQGKVIDFSDYPYVFQSGDLLDWMWSYSTSASGQSMKISRVYQEGIQKKTIKIAVMSDYRLSQQVRSSEFRNAVNYLLETIEVDCRDNVRGKLYCNDKEYICCNIIGSSKADWNMNKSFMFNSFTLVVENPVWISESSYTFKASDAFSTNNKRYRGRYKYRYANGLTNSALTNDNFYESNFRMTIYGPVVKPLLIVGGYRYYTDVVLEERERLEINSINKTVLKIMKLGDIENCFHNRDKQNSIFRPIPPGKQSIDWSGKFDFDITLFSERSEPSWS